MANMKTSTKRAELAKATPETRSGSRLRSPAPKEKDRAGPAPQIRLFQYFNLPEQRPFLDPGFEALDNIGHDAPLAALDVLTRQAQRAELTQASLWGALSWDFGETTGMTAQELRQQIAGNPGHDAYFIYPHPQIEALYQNVWQHGETLQPHFLALSKEFFRAAKLPVDLLKTLQPPRLFGTTDCVLATPAFWNSYLAWISMALKLAEKNMPPAAFDMLYSSAPDEQTGRATAPCIRLIVERLLSVYLHSDEGRQFKACKLVPANPPAPPDVHLRLLADMRRVACQSRSTWLASCWANYRDLYCAERFGAAWASKHLKPFAANEVIFPSNEADIISTVSTSTPTAAIIGQPQLPAAAFGVPA
ncbi:hypothetical protein [Lacisediminimonas profundi]|uniref:hypothetical protein n=1 Tax=Lacisediminimonas profundi TaxID=2603856 RepID=UPI00124B003F|nr:hypothetical protein [Lacisediminimonas profundi]